MNALTPAAPSRIIKELVISFGGIFIEAGEVPAFGTKVMLRVRFPGQAVDMTLPGIVRWIKATGFGVQFGLLGVRETHALTQFLRTRL